jgi:hypothetical protein
MDRNTVLEWLREHPGAIEGDAEAVVSRCERAVRRHAREDAWVAARRYVTERKREWEGSHGAHASEAFVAREVCEQVAEELAHHEPAPHPGDEDHLAGGGLKAALGHEAWMMMIPWIMTLAREEEHRTWNEIVDHTRRRARDLIQDHRLSNDTDFDHTKCYGDVAAWISGLLAVDYSHHAFPRGTAE